MKQIDNVKEFEDFMRTHNNLPVPEIKEEDKTVILNYLESKTPFLLEGTPGIGKSLSAKFYGNYIYFKNCKYNDAKKNFKCLENKDKFCPFVKDGRQAYCIPLKIDITEDTEVRHLIGELNFIKFYEAIENAKMKPEGTSNINIADFFDKGPLFQAMEDGRLIIIEELDRAGRDTLFSIFFDPIESKELYIPEKAVQTTDNANNKSTGMLYADKGFNIIITANRGTDAGTIRMPKALLRRLRRLSLYDRCRIYFE